MAHHHREVILHHKGILLHRGTHKDSCRGDIPRKDIYKGDSPLHKAGTLPHKEAIHFHKEGCHIHRAICRDLPTVTHQCKDSMLACRVGPHIISLHCHLTVANNQCMSRRTPR